MPNTKPAATKENLAFGQRLVALLEASGQQRRGAGRYLADRYKVSAVTANDWLNGKFRPSTDLARAIAEDHGSTFGHLYFGEAGSNATHARYSVREAGSVPYSDSQEIPFSDARGACGGGAINWDADERQPLIKEGSWFRRYRVKPENLLAVWADGDSMADFIVDGDIVIFDTSKTNPKSGAIFLINHPDGLRIKRLRRLIDGGWALESANPDKHRYPNENIAPDHADLLKILGEFVYRQGG